MPTSTSTQLRAWLLALPRGTKRAVLASIDAIAAAGALWFALVLKLDAVAAGLQVPPWVYIWAAGSAVLAFAVFGLYHAVLRFISVPALFAICFGALVSALVVGVSGHWGNHDLTRSAAASLAVIYALSLIGAVCVVRILARRLVTPGASRRLPVVIYGAGEAGAQLAAALGMGGKMHVVAYVDHKTSLQGATVGGVRVFSPDALTELVADFNVGHVLIAIPGATRRRRSEVIAGLVRLGVHVQTVPDLYEIMAGRASVSDLREVSIADLLGRDSVAPRDDLLGACIKGKSVMVTGAGGSIGSELCRQIMLQAPRLLVLLDVSEPALYQIDRELRLAMQHRGLQFELITLLGNTRHRERLAEIMRAYKVQTVYHAAAYKHVPIVEQNIIEGIHNNVFATWGAAEAAIDACVETFLLISTDKAVNPTNVMGATKRYAEIVLQALQKRQRSTRLCMVRFGNVLGSSGSVVPLFQEQIKAGGPVTVTHKDVRRYFMTIPEAASLVIQAGSMARGGEVFLLDMGEPVRIDDLARRMIALSGHTVRDKENPEGDIEVRYTGLRPGEKLYEELLIGNNPSGTEHPMIMSATEHAPEWEVVALQLERMREALARFDSVRGRALLVEAVAEYIPANRIHDLVWEAAQAPVVVSLPERRSVESAQREGRAHPRLDG